VKKTNFLPSFPTTLFGSRKRSLQEQISKERQQLSACGLSDLALLFNSLLPASFLQEITSNKRKRVYTEVVVFWAWLAQVLMFNASCSKAVTMLTRRQVEGSCWQLPRVLLTEAA
jgi:hypothetical protein